MFTWYTNHCHIKKPQTVYNQAQTPGDSLTKRFFNCSEALDATNLQGRQLIDNKRLSQSYDELNSKFYLTGLYINSLLQMQYKSHNKNSTKFV